MLLLEDASMEEDDIKQMLQKQPTHRPLVVEY